MRALSLAGPGQYHAGEEEEAEHDPRKPAVAEPLVDFRTEPGAGDAARDRGQRRQPDLPGKESRPSVGDQRCAEDREVEGLQDASPVVLGIAADVGPQDDRRTGNAGETTENAAAKAGDAVGNRPAARAARTLPAKKRVGGVEHEKEADADLE